MRSITPQKRPLSFVSVWQESLLRSVTQTVVAPHSGFCLEIPHSIESCSVSHFIYCLHSRPSAENREKQCWTEWELAGTAGPGCGEDEGRTGREPRRRSESRGKAADWRLGSRNPAAVSQPSRYKHLTSFSASGCMMGKTSASLMKFLSKFSFFIALEKYAIHKTNTIINKQTQFSFIYMQNRRTTNLITRNSIMQKRPLGLKYLSRLSVKAQ